MVSNPLGKLWGKFTDVNKANEHISNAYEALRRVIEVIGHDRWRAMTRKAYGEDRWQHLTLAQNVGLLVNETSTLISALQSKDRDIDRLSARIEEQETSLRTWANKHRNDVAAMSATITGLQEEAVSQERSFLTSMAVTKKNHMSELKRHEERSNAIQSNLRRDIKSRNTALVARDTVPQLTDGELKAMFSDLVREVDALARLKWTNNRSPWTTEQQQHVSDTPKRLQRWILQDTVWNTLFKNIFSSPFRVLGKKGSALEQEWSAQFGKMSSLETENNPYPWPEPSFACERWRYETMRECQEALKVRLSEYSPRADLSKGFQETLECTQTEVSAALQLVARLDETTAQSVLIICEKAARMWVTCGSQRCRLMVVMKGLNTATKLKAKSSQDQCIEFVIRPELKRVGDSQGELFDDVTTVNGCEGEAIQILYGS